MWFWKVEYRTPKIELFGDFLVVYWLKFYASKAGGLGSISGQGTRSHMPQLRVNMLQVKIPHAAAKTQCSQINKYTLKNIKTGLWWRHSPAFKELIVEWGHTPSAYSIISMHSTEAVLPKSLEASLAQQGDVKEGSLEEVMFGLRLE